ncbi:GDSL esterase/lipase At3g48460 [Quercus suber]|uniref:GDSL esterase/lipase At3g48460 n=1 Tax=Quercus suber TaxID=58331 RepID=UPI000D2E6D72|nr:gdsl esterase/lipase [Quercus suber]
MANSKYLFLQIACFILLLSLSPSYAHNKSHESTPPLASFLANVDFKGCFNKVYAFGDSDTDTGNAHNLGYLKSFISTLFSHAWSPYCLSENSKLSGYRLSNGRLVIDFLCEALNIPHLSAYKDSSKNFSSGANFAIAGSTALSSNLFGHFNFGNPLMWKPNPENILTQIDWFHKFVGERECQGKDETACKLELGNALFWIGEIGGNDYARLFASSIGPAIANKQFTEQVVDHICTLALGAKFLVVQGLPPIGCLPLQLATCPSNDRDQNGCSASANSVIKGHNNLLQKRLDEIRIQHKDSMILFIDYYSAFTTILEKHSQYQFKEPFKACCGAGGGPFNYQPNLLCGAFGTSTCKNSSTHINFDGVHLTENMHQHLFDLFFNQGFCTPSFVDLIKKKKGQY